jgi:hypothetical protein
MVSGRRVSRRKREALAGIINLMEIDASVIPGAEWGLFSIVKILRSLGLPQDDKRVGGIYVYDFRRIGAFENIPCRFSIGRPIRASLPETMIGRSIRTGCAANSSRSLS